MAFNLKQTPSFRFVDMEIPYYIVGTKTMAIVIVWIQTIKMSTIEDKCNFYSFLDTKYTEFPLYTVKPPIEFLFIFSLFGIKPKLII